MNAETEKSTTPEERFLGVRTEIDTDLDEHAENLQAQPEAQAGADGDEMEDYSERVQKRINKMTWEKNEERRQRQQAEALREEAIRFAQGALRQNQQLEHTLHTGEAQLIGQVQRNAQAEVANAKRKLQQVYEEGDSAAIVKAQEELLGAQAQQYAAWQAQQNYQSRQVPFQQRQMMTNALASLPSQQAAQMQAQRAGVRPPPPRPTDEASDWASKNSWFGKDKALTAYAYGLHEKLMEKGVQIDSPEYYQQIDQEMHQRFPEKFQNSSGPTTVVAPATRERGGGRKTQVRLNEHEMELARRLGITYEQYAASKLAGEQKHGQ